MTKAIFSVNTLMASCLLGLCVTSAGAQDISSEQKAAYEARKALHKKQSNHQSLTKRVSAQEKRVDDELARLNSLRAEEQVAKRDLDQAKVDLDSKVDALNNVWDLRDR